MVNYARTNRIDADVFVLLSLHGQFQNGHLPEELELYRSAMRRPYAKLIVCALGCRDFSFQTPGHPGVYNISDTEENVPELLQILTNVVP